MATPKTIELVFRTRGADKASQQTRKVDKGLVRLGKSALKAGTAFYAGRAIINALRHAADQAVTFELTVAKLNQVMTAMGRFTPQASKALQNYADSLQNVTLFSNTAILRGLTFLQTYKQIPDDVMPRAIETMLDLATLMEGDVQSAANMVGKAAMGLSGELRKVGITVDETIGKSGDFVAILGEIEKQSGGVAKAAGDTMAGQMKQAGHALDDLAREFGFLLAPAIKKSADELSDFARGLRAILSPETLSTQDIQLEIAGLRKELEHPIIPAKGMFKEFLEEEIEALERQMAIIKKQEDERKKVIVSGILRDEQEQKITTAMQDTSRLAAQTATNLARAAIQGESLGKVMAQVAVEALIIAAQTRLINALMSMGPTSGFSSFAGALFGIEGVTGQTPTINNNINISGGLVSDSYVRNTLSPALSRVKSFG